MTVAAAIDERRVTEPAARGIVARPDRIAAWMLVARPGDEFVYATRLRTAALPKDSAGAAKMRDLHAAGLVILFQRNAGDSEGQWRNYVARRTQAAVPQPKTALAKASTVGVGPAAVDAVLAILTKRALLGRPCPSETMLSSLTGLDGAVCAAVMRVLVEDGAIHVETAPAPTARFVTILATGQRTGVAK